MDIIELQKERIEKLEKIISDQSQQISTLIEQNNSLSQVLEYLTDEEFRKFAFKLKYNELVTCFLENESQGDVLL